MTAPHICSTQQAVVTLHALCPSRRAMAVDCLGWYAFLDRSSSKVTAAVGLLSGLVMQENVPRVQQPALKGLTRLACVLGPAVVSQEMAAAGQSWLCALLLAVTS